MKLTNALNLPEPFVDAVSSEYTYTDKRYSVTSILKGTREAILTRRHTNEIVQDVANMVWLIFGSAVHSLLEKSQESTTQLKEEWVSAKMPNGYELSGRFDLYDDADGTVTDYKTGSVNKVLFNDWDDHRKQTLAYCWILQQNGFSAHRGQIVMMLKDHSMTKAEHDPSYPQVPVHIETWDFNDYEIEAFGNWAAYKFEEIERCESLPDDELPLCTPSERWHKDDAWAVKKPGNKKATRLCKTKDEAEELREKYESRDGKKYIIEYRAGEDSKCLRYCSAKAFCNHYKELMNNA